MEWMWKSKLFFYRHAELVLAYFHKTLKQVQGDGILFFMFLFFFPLIVFSEDTSLVSSQQATKAELRMFDEKRWENLTKDLNYSEAFKKKKASKDFNLPNVNVNQSVLKVVLIVLVVFTLVFLLYKFFGNTKFLNNQKIKSGDFLFLEQVEENLELADLEKFLRDALDKKQFKLAVRIYYLMAIKELFLRNYIKWKKDKTNFEYLGEMRERKEFEHFHSLTKAFEIVWYGDVEINESEYAVLSPSFTNFLSNLRGNGQK